MMNLSRFSKMSFTELASLPNYYIHEIYKLYVEDYKARVKKEKEEAKAREAKERQEARLNNMRNGVSDSGDVMNLREMLASQGLDSQNLSELMEEIEDES